MTPFNTLTSYLLALSSTALLLGSEPRPPNLIVIMTDDQGYADVGFNGHLKDFTTPHLDRLAAEGVIFTDGYVTYSVCGPSRAGFITGRYQQRFGFERNPAWRPADPTVGLPLEERTLAEALRPLGYTSSIIGKWHLGGHDRFHPLNRGFDEFYGHLGGGKRYFPSDLTIKNTLDARNEPESYRSWITRGFEPVRTEHYLTEEFTREALDFVRRQAATPDSPFFLFLSYNAPHAPMQAPEEDIARFPHIEDEKRRIYAAMVTVLDRGVGELLDLLDTLNLSENTLVFFLSDNGGPTSSNASSNAPFRGTKSTPFEGGIRVPFAARWPGVIPAGLRFTQPVSSLDIFGTIAALSHYSPDPQRPLDGVNLIPYLRGEKAGAPHERIYLRMFDRGVFAFREGDFKIVRPQNIEQPRLFNLRLDPTESRDLHQAQPQRTSRLLKTYQEWNAQLIAPTFDGLDMREWSRPQPPLNTR